MAKTITITLNDAQAEKLEEFFNGGRSQPYITQDNDGTVHAVNVTDDHTVESIMISPNGDYIHEELEGLGMGWAEIDRSAW